MRVADDELLGESEMPHSCKQDRIILKYFFNSMNSGKIPLKLKEKLLVIFCPVTFFRPSRWVSKVGFELSHHKSLAISQSCPVIFV